MTGAVIQINISRGELPKLPVPEAHLTPFGIEGDTQAHSRLGSTEYALVIACAEIIDELSARGYPLFYGALGENLTVAGLDVRSMRPGQRYRIGSALIELTALRPPCANFYQYGHGFVNEICDEAARAGNTESLRWGWSGFHAAVMQPGIIRVHDIISLESALV